MSRLHDIKSGLANVKSKGTAVISRTAADGIGKFIGISGMKFQQALSKEDPEKVKAFLEDLASDLELPLEVRRACRQLLDGMKTGKPVEQVMHEKTIEGIQNLESQLEVTLKKQDPAQ